ncbi:curli-like amyloid fiber formation chaperone CsgH [Hymenobacter glacieicola]|nr:curli-like amyloid fiber formation chaperone CsgH [Hymenobacter glacieicola]
MLQAVPSQPGSAPCQARLAMHQEGNMLTLIGEGQNNTSQPMRLRYELLTSRQGKAGTSRNAQSGNVTLAPNQKAALSQTSINISPSDHYQIHLRLFDSQDHVVAHDSLQQ